MTKEFWTLNNIYENNHAQPCSECPVFYSELETCDYPCHECHESNRDVYNKCKSVCDS